MTELELLAPARNVDIGIAAINCGADAVYIAGPEFGARKDAGNSIEDIARLCSWAHRFGVRIFVTLNTILFNEEIDAARSLVRRLDGIGVDALIVQDPAVLELAGRYAGDNGLAQMRGRDYERSCGATEKETEYPGKETAGAGDLPTNPDKHPSSRGASEGQTERETDEAVSMGGWHSRMAMHASTQCAIRTPEKALFYKNLGFSRLVLERELSLAQVKEIYDATHCEIEFFVHGALCVCYSGQCYMSEMIAGRSANRGACIQACRSRYDLVDSRGKVIVKDKALLSLKDYNLISRLEDLAEAGVCSFKIEGRLKNISYVSNTVREYSQALDDLVAKYPDKYRRTSFGKVTGGFVPDMDKTFNRGYTQLNINGIRERGWAAMDTPKSVGQRIGTVEAVRPLPHGEMEVRVRFETGQRLGGGAVRDIVLANGDGFAFVTNGGITGFRGDVCKGNTIRCKAVNGIAKDTVLYRNIDVAFEKEISVNAPARTMSVEVILNAADGHVEATAISEDGRKASVCTEAAEPAGNQDRMRGLMEAQLSKKTGHYSFQLVDIKAIGALPIMSASALNGIRRSLAEDLDKLPVNARKMAGSGIVSSSTAASSVKPTMYSVKEETAAVKTETSSVKAATNSLQTVTYKDNVANHISEEIYRSHGSVEIEPAYELTHRAGAELMRTKYCIRFELGLCPVHQGAKDTGPIFLLNGGRRFALGFDCKTCEMTVTAALK